MKNAREDLAGSVSGRFSPEDWRAILIKAHEKWLRKRREEGMDAAQAWREVVLDFVHNDCWGFASDYRPSKDPGRRRNLGLSLLLRALFALTVTKIAIMWFGQIYSRSDDPQDGWIFFLVLLLVVGNFAYFLWRTRHYRDDDSNGPV
ncbi:MAG: hypothetical protein HC902_09665 [Calothrix sp. SM1_5_4]|nr:hypothetical protein [Calothrix sp. SM1_5_4]